MQFRLSGKKGRGINNGCFLLGFTREKKSRSFQEAIDFKGDMKYRDFVNET